MESNTLLVVGNGLDLSLGFKTSYHDFLRSEEFANIQDSSLSKFLLKNEKLKNWVDIEEELSSYCTMLYTTPQYMYDDAIKRDLRKEYEELRSELTDFLKRVEHENLNVPKDNYAVSLLQYFLFHQIEPIEVVTFNYTDNLERICELLNIKVNVYHIHGSLDKGIVFGVEDTAKLDKREVYLYKAYSPYKQLKPLMRLLSNSKNIIFYGYSMGDTDKQYFQSYFKNLANSDEFPHNITIYYYGQESYDTVKWQLQSYTDHSLSSLEMNHNVEYIDCKDPAFRDPL